MSDPTSKQLSSPGAAKRSPSKGVFKTGDEFAMRGFLLRVTDVDPSGRRLRVWIIGDAPEEAPKGGASVKEKQG